MAFVLKATQLLSRTIRKEVGASGIRKLSLGALSQSQEQEGGLISNILDAGKRFVGSLVGIVWEAASGLLSISFSALWSGVVSATQFIWNFNWRVTDQELKNQVTSAFNGLGGHLGELSGQAFGWLSCGAVPGLVIFSFNEAMALYVLKEVGEEAYSELIAQASTLMYSVFNITAQATFAWAYKNVRNLFLREDGLLDSAVGAGMMSQSAADQFRQSALEKEPWSFALAFEEKVESIDNQLVQNFVEGFFEGATESCVEAGYVVANSVDSFLVMQGMRMQQTLGEEATVEMQLPNYG